MIFDKPPENFHSIFEVVVCAIEFHGKILLLHRQDHKPQGNQFGLVGGKIEKQETPYDAIIREIYEETGLLVEPSAIESIKKVYARQEHYDVVVHLFKIVFESYPSIIIQQTDHKTYLWCEPQHAIMLPNGMEDMDSCVAAIYSIDIS